MLIEKIALNKQKKGKFNFVKATIGIGILVFVIAFFVTLGVTSNNRNKQIMSTINTYVPIDISAPVDLIDNYTFLYEDDAPQFMPEIENAPVMANLVLEWTRPAKGEILMSYSEDDLVYNKTMEDWRVHLGVDYSGDIGSSVLAAADGEVISVGFDDEWGNYIEIAHIDGYISRYCNLQNSPPVSRGDTVTKGQVIGGMGRTAAAESSEAPHLHFEVLWEGRLVNPSELN